MPPLIRIGLTGLLLVACASEAPRESAAQEAKPRKDASGIDACALLTFQDIEAAAGWTPDAADPETHGKTATCTFHRADGPKVQSIALVISPATDLGKLR